MRRVACGQMRDLGAVTTYAHPVFAPGDDADGDPDDLFRPYRMVEARAGRTVVTNGPWLTLDVDGHGPGAVLDRGRGKRLRVRARTVGGEVERLVLHGPDGVLASGAGELEHEATVDGGFWLAAAAYGDADPHTVGAPVFAHTTPVYVDVDGRRVGRVASAQWCLRLLDGVEELAAEQGRFAPGYRERQLGDLIAVLDRARAFYRSVS